MRHRVLAYIQEHPGADACEIARVLRYGLRGVVEVCDELIAEGLIDFDEEDLTCAPSS